MENKIVRAGVGVFVFKDGKFIMIQRKGSHGEGSWSVPGGHIEFSESLEETAKREILEETNLSIRNVRIGAVTNDYFRDEGKHYITVWLLSDYQGGKERIMEPDKCLDQDGSRLIICRVRCSCLGNNF